MKNKIKELYLKGYSAREIADELEKKEGSIKMFINRNLKEFNKLHKEQSKLRKALQNLNEFEAIKELYLKGYNAKEIAMLRNVTHGYMRGYISQNLKKYSFEHRKARDLNKSIIKAINTMNNSYMSNQSFLRQNRQSYNYDKKGNLEFDEVTRGTRPTDVPKKIYRKSNII